MVHEAAPQIKFTKVGNIGIIVAVLGAVLMAVGMGAGDSAWHAYMYGWICFAAIVLGAFGLTLLHHLVRGSWGLSALRILEAAGGPAAILTLAATFVPIWLKREIFYHHWLHPEIPWKHPFKTWWHTDSTFLARTILCFLIWFLLAYVLRESSRRQDSSNSMKEQQFRTDLSAGGLILFFITITSAITDWVMSMDPHWFSSIYGVWFAIGGALMALTLATWIVCRYRDAEPYKSIITPGLTKDLGNMCFALTMLWGYTSLSQWLIIWSGNLPEFIKYYTERNMKAPLISGLNTIAPGLEITWLALLGGSAIIFGFFVPWFALLAPRVKAKPHLLQRIVLFAFVIRFIDLYYHIIPFMRKEFHWTDIAALVFFGGLWAAVFGKSSEQTSLYAEHDQRLVEMAQQQHAH